MGELKTFLYNGIIYTGRIQAHDNVGTAVKVITPNELRGDVLNWAPGGFEKIMETPVDPSVSDILYQFTQDGMNYTGHILYMDDLGITHVLVESPAHSKGVVLSFKPGEFDGTAINPDPVNVTVVRKML